MLTIRLSQTVIDTTPADVLLRLDEKTGELCRTLLALPPKHALWDSLHRYGLIVDVPPWRFHVRLEPPDVLFVERALLPIP